MTGLKTYLPFLTRFFDLTPAALYERQRALVRLRLLKTSSGRGPGSGVRLTPQSVAVLITSILMADNWSEIDERVGKIISATTGRQEILPIEAQTFGAALAEILSDPRAAADVNVVIIRRTWMQALIYWNLSYERQTADGLLLNEAVSASFSPSRTPLRAKEHALYVEARISGDALLEIAKSLAHDGEAK